MRKIFFSFLMLFLSIPLFTFAQEEKNIEQMDEQKIRQVFEKIQQEDFDPESLSEEERMILKPIIPSSPEIEGTVNCFDHYNFGSVQVVLEAQTASSVSGSQATFKGYIENNNDYPLVDGAVYIKVFRKDKDIEQINGFHLVDQFFAEEDIALDANEKRDFTLNWDIPAYATSGEYQIATFFITSKAYNLLGLSFTDDIVGNVADFSVVGENQDTVLLNKNLVRVGDQEFRFAAFPPRVKNDEDITVYTTVENRTDATQTVPVTWDIYYWDGIAEEKRLDKVEENITLGANEKKEISYTVKDKKHSVYFVVVQAEYKDLKSVQDIRFVREDVESVRINFPSIKQFPLKKNQSSELFSCLHGSGTKGVVDNNKLLLTLKDRNGTVIHEYTYEGQVTGSMMGVLSEFTPEKDYDYVSLTAKLYNNNTLVDESTMIYDCHDINPAQCLKKDGKGDNLTKSKKHGVNTKTTAVAIVIILFIISMIAIVVMKKKNN